MIDTTKTDELIEECIVLEGMYEKKVAQMLRVAADGLRSIETACDYIQDQFCNCDCHRCTAACRAWLVAGQTLKRVEEMAALVFLTRLSRKGVDDG
jgi:hypothetical protein